MQQHFSNYTQSQKLIEFGFPVDTADCYLIKAFGAENFNYCEKQILPADRDYSQISSVDTFPCWSMGRILEIIRECTPNKWILMEIIDNFGYINITDIEDSITSIINIIESYKDVIDLSKLK